MKKNEQSFSQEIALNQKKRDLAVPADSLISAPFASSNCAYVHDGSLEGLLTAVFLAFERHEFPDDVVAERIYQPRLGQECITVSTDIEKALRVRRGIENYAGSAAFHAVIAASLCDDYDAGAAVLHFVAYVVYSFKKTRYKNALGDLANPAVRRIVELKTRALNEAEKIRQFLRFSHLENGIWFARINPMVSVIPLVIGHFASRFNDQAFVIYDENHLLSGMYDGNSWQLVSGAVTEVGNPCYQDAFFEEAWRSFYDALCVDARYNPELRQSFMPQRFWKNLPEMMPHQHCPRCPTQS